MNGNFIENLISLIKEKKSIVCVGLDPNFEGKKSIPNYLLEENEQDYNNTIYEFNKIIIENTYKYVPIYKPQSAFYEKYDAIDALKRTIEFIRKKGNLCILDAKRNDIGNTSEAYAESIFKDIQADSTTINGYLGSDCVKPFMKYNNKGLFILVKTSNKSSGEFQDQWVLNPKIKEKMEKPDYREIIKKIEWTEKELIDENSFKKGYLKYSDLPKSILPEDSNQYLIRNYILMARLMKNWSDESLDFNNQNNYSNIGAVVGATYPEQMNIIRNELPNSFFLIPGYGAQGGTAKDIVNGINSDGLGAIVNSSRGIDYAYVTEINGEKFKMEEFGEAARKSVELMNNDINSAMKSVNKIPWK